MTKKEYYKILYKVYKKASIKMEKDKKKWKPSKEHLRKVEDIQLLEKYSKWLEKHSYIDADWWCGEPKAIDEFMEELENGTIT